MSRISPGAQEARRASDGVQPSATSRPDDGLDVTVRLPCASRVGPRGSLGHVANIRGQYS
jgi:hypothetical protein